MLLRESAQSTTYFELSRPTINLIRVTVAYRPVVQVMTTQASHFSPISSHTCKSD